MRKICRNMPQQCIGECFIKWFYLLIIIQIFCTLPLKCRQHHTKHHKTHRTGSSIYDENSSSNDEIYDSVENDGNNLNGVNATPNDNELQLFRRDYRKEYHNHNHNNNHFFNNRYHNGDDNDVSLWINEQQLKILSALYFPQGYSDRIYAIENGHVLNDIREFRIYKYIAIPSEVNYVNFTWKSGARKYFYNFDRLQTLDDSILKAPTLSIKTNGRIPHEEKNFSIFLPCTGNSSGTAMFSIGLSIENRRGKPLPGTPIRLNFKKECAHRGVYDSLDASNPTSLTSQGPDPECNLKCGNNGFCNHHKICQCKVGYTGQYCQTAFCFPQCMNGGNCTAPAVCECPDGYQGTQCEGGICKEKCLNGGKCIQKDKCQCSKGYYGFHCEFSKCAIPCKNGGRCIGNNLCRCPNGLRGNHCEIGRRQRSACKCKNGICLANKKCKCDAGYYGRHCHSRIKKQ